MLRAFRYELNPNKTQKEQIKQTCGCCRLVYNYMLDVKKTAYEVDKINLSKYDLINLLPNLKKDSKYSFLKDVSSKALQQSIINLGTAYNNFFRKKNSTGFPKFKKKGVRDSFRIPEACKIDYNTWKVKIAKIGEVKIFKGRNKPVAGNIKSYTISHTGRTDRYYISILFEVPDKPKLNNNKSVGIDLGVKNFAILSDGRVFESQKYFKSNLKKLRILQRTADRRYNNKVSTENQSNNWKKAVKQLAKLHEHIAFQRKDFLNKVSTEIARNYSTVCVETLNVKKMLMKSNRKLSQLISDCGWSMFITMLGYKCDNLIKIDKYFASSQTCSNCNYVEKKVKDLSVRSWICPNCNTEHDRDKNAAKNILREGLSLCGPKVSNNTMLVPGAPLVN